MLEDQIWEYICCEENATAVYFACKENDLVFMKFSFRRFYEIGMKKTEDKKKEVVFFFIYIDIK